MTRAALSSLSLGIVLAVAGCGGGGGSVNGSNNPQVELVEITSGNAKAVAAAALTSSLEGGSFGEFALPGVATFGVGSTKSATLYAKVGSIQGKQAVSLVKQSQTGIMQTPIGPATEECDAGGTVTVSGDIADPQTLSNGDTMTLAFAECDDGFSVVNGTLTMTINQFSGNVDTGQFTLGVTLELAGFEVVEEGETTTAEGDVTMTVDMDAASMALTVTSTSLSVGSGGLVHSLSGYSLSQTVDTTTGDYSIEAEGTVTSSSFDGAANFETVQPFVGLGAGHPFAGELLITGADGATIRATVLDQQFVRLEIDTDGDGTPDETVDVEWSELGEG